MNQFTVRRRARLSTSYATRVARSESNELDIADIRHFPLREPVSKRQYSLLRVTTRSGLVGWGECRYDPNGDIEALRSSWNNRPANAYATVPASDPFRAALDMAALDIMGRAAQAPVYRILGGPTRSKVRAYSSPQSDGSPISVIELPAPVSRNQGKAYQNRLLSLVDAVHPDHDFIIAAKGGLTPGDAASVARTLEGKHPLFFDEPCAHSNIDAVRKVADETVVPLAFGAGIDDAGVFQALLREGLIDLVRPDIGIFGITGTKRIAALAEPYYVAVAPRQDGGPIATAASIHLAASIPNFFIQHVPLPAAEQDRAMRRELVPPPLEAITEGFLNLLNSPGLGITVDESALARYRAS